MSLQDALSDLKAEVLNGKSVAEVVSSIARDYGVNPVLLTRKFGESYGSEEAVRANAAATSVEAVMPGKIDAAVDEMCRYYGVAKSLTKLAKVNGQLYTLICHVPECSTWLYRAVRHEDAAKMKLSRGTRIEIVRNAA